MKKPWSVPCFLCGFNVARRRKINDILNCGKRGLVPFIFLVLIAGYAAPVLALTYTYCSPYQGNSTVGGTSASGNTTGYIATINEYYFGNAANFAEIQITNLNGDGNSAAPSSVWSNWSMAVTYKSGSSFATITAPLNQAAVTACYEGQVTYFWIPSTAFTGAPSSLPFVSSSTNQIMLLDGSGNDIDMLAGQNTGTVTLWPSINVCSQLTTGNPYQTETVLGSLGNKDIVRVPNATGNWIVSGSSNVPAASGTTPVVSGSSVTGTIAACSVSPNNSGIAVSKTVTTTPSTGLAPGATVGFSVKVKNQTTTAQAVTVTDTLPAGMTYVAGSAVSTPAGTLASFPPTWITPSLAAGGSATLTFNATVNSNVPDGSSLTNTVSAPLPSSTLTATSSAGVTNIVNPLTITKTVDKANPIVGQTVTFTVTVTNKQSPGPTSITVTDMLPSSPGTWNWVVTPSAGSTYSAGVWTITGIGNAALGGQTTATLTATATVPSGTTGYTYTNTAQMTAVSPAEPNLVLPLSAAASFTVAVTVAVPVSSFNAFQTSTAASAITGNIYTKLAGVAAGLQSGADGLDVVAISAGAQATGFNGNVKLDLLANTGTPGSGYGADNCPTSNTVIQTVASSAISGGRSSVSFSSVANAYRDVRVRISYPTLIPTVTSCSTDSFAIRPQAFTVTSTNATQTGSSGTPTFKAGAGVFSLTAASVAGYDGTPVIDNTKVAGTPTAGAIAGTFGAAPAGTGTATGSSFSYSEVGNFGLNANAVYDFSFTNSNNTVDQPGVDCTADFSNTLVGGKYGCYIGSTAVPQTTGSSGFGRFIPDHFAITLPSIAAACSTGTAFTYFGQDGFTSNFALAAQNSSNNTTSNYAGAYAKLNLTTWSNFGFTAATLPAGSALATSATAPTGTWSSGIANPVSAKHQISRPTALTGPTTITLSALPVDSDGVTMPSATSLGSVLLRYGRLRLIAGQGSELAPFKMQTEVQYWDGTYWRTNTADSCTSYASGNFAISGTTGTTASTATGINQGYGSLLLTKPTSAGMATICLDMASTGTGCTGSSSASLSYLLGNWNGSLTYDKDPSATVRFGGANSNSRGNWGFLYRRENF